MKGKRKGKEKNKRLVRRRWERKLTNKKEELVKIVSNSEKCCDKSGNILYNMAGLLCLLISADNSRLCAEYLVHIAMETTTGQVALKPQIQMAVPSSLMRGFIAKSIN